MDGRRTNPGHLQKTNKARTPDDRQDKTNDVRRSPFQAAQVPKHRGERRAFFVFFLWAFQKTFRRNHTKRMRPSSTARSVTGGPLEDTLRSSGGR